MADPEKETWNTDKMRENRNTWSLAADTQLLQYMQQFSQNLLSETHSTLNAVNDLESQVATTCVEVSNLGSKLWAMSDTQFVENRVYDDDEVVSPTSPVQAQVKTEEDNETVVINRLKEAIQNGLNVLDTKFEMIQVPVSDSDDDDSSPQSGVVMKPLNRYKDRRLPHLIGSADFRADDSLGLRDLPSDEETDDFMSASDKEAYDESEDSDMESEQTKSENLLHQNEDNILRSNPLSPPKQLPAHVVPSPGFIGDVLRDSDIAKKPLFSSWQASDLWTPDEDIQKGPDDISANYRPPSAASSVSSAQSSTVSEPVKKTSEDFGKSGSGRMPVFVQEDHNDLFEPSPPASHQPQPKKPIPAGGIKIFQGDFNPFPNKHQSKDAQSEQSEQSQQDKWEDDDENDIFKQSHNISSKSLSKSSLPSSTNSKKKDNNLFDDEIDGDLFSGPTRSNISNSRNISNDTKIKSVSKNAQSSKSLLFDDTGSGAEDEDDLFSSRGTFSNLKAQNLFADDEIQSDSKNMFSNNDKSEKTNSVNSIPKQSASSLFSDRMPPQHDFSSSKNSEKSFTAKTGKGSFPNEVDLFGDVGISDNDDLFGSSPVPKQVNNYLQSKDQNVSLPPKKNVVSTNFWENEDDDLFSNTSTSFAKHTDDADLLFSSSSNVLEKVETQAVGSKSDIFSSLKLTEDRMKEKRDVSKLRKGLETRSLFESDSDDDLFSSPQGSLSSRKSVQLANTSIESKDKQKPVSVNKEDKAHKESKTDFSSIFSDDINEQSNIITSLKVSTKDTSDFFEEDKGLFASSNVDIKTPDLFKTTSSDAALSKEILKESNSKVNYEKKITVEAVNPSLVNSASEPFKSTKDSSPENVDLFDDKDDKIIEVVNVKKSEPPRTLDIKPISESLSSTTSNLKEENKAEVASQKPAVLKKPLKQSSPGLDPLDSDISAPTALSKAVPGKLKASQLININTAALLPGSKPQIKSEKTSDSEVPTNKIDVEDRPIFEDKQVLTIPAAKVSLPPRTSKSDSSLSTQEDSILPPTSGLLQSVNKERPKIQGKRRPSSRRARQEAIRASSIEVENEITDTDPPPPVSSALMSPSTDEEDLFGVPPLDIITDNAKATSPKTDIFGTPTVLSPVIKERSSSFVSTPFVSSQPPPLNEEDDTSTQDDDLFGYQDNLFVSSDRETKLFNNTKRDAVKENVTKELFGNKNNVSLFPDIRAAPPPLIIDDDDDEDDEDDLFMSNSKHKSNVSDSFESFNRTTIDSSLLSNESPPKLGEDDSILSESSAKTEDSLFSPVLKKTSENPVNDSNSEVSDDNTIPFLSDSSLKSSSDNDLFDSTVSTSQDSINTVHSSFEKDLFSEESLFSTYNSRETTSVTQDSSSRSVSDVSVSSSGNANKTTKVQKPPGSIGPERISLKKESLFGEDEEADADSLFLSGPPKMPKSVPSVVRSSLFGDDDQDDDSGIFGASTFTSRSTGSSQTSASQRLLSGTSQKNSGTTQKGTKSRSSGSLKPVKLQTKQTFSDPLLGNND